MPLLGGRTPAGSRLGSVLKWPGRWRYTPVPSAFLRPKYAEETIVSATYNFGEHLQDWYSFIFLSKALYLVRPCLLYLSNSVSQKYTIFSAFCHCVILYILVEKNNHPVLPKSKLRACQGWNMKEEVTGESITSEYSTLTYNRIREFGTAYIYPAELWRLLLNGFWRCQGNRTVQIHVQDCRSVPLKAGDERRESAPN